MANNYVIGVDGGASKTLCYVATIEGKKIGEGLAGCANKNVTGWEEALSQVRLAVICGLEDAQVDPENIIGAHYGLGGVSGQMWENRWRTELEFLSPKANIMVENDVFLPIYAESANGHGIAIVSGSGGNIGIITTQGKCHIDGRVHFASSQLGQAALNVMLGEIQRGEKSAFTTKLLEDGGFRGDDVFVTQARIDPKALRFKLSPLVTKWAVAGQTQAVSIVHEWLSRVSDDLTQFFADYNHIISPSLSVCFGGTTFSSMQELVRREVSANLPWLDPIRLHVIDMHPAGAAVIAALRHC